MYYKYLNFKDPDYYDYTVMKETFDQHKKTLGYRRLSAVLTKQTGWVVNAKKVLRLMRKFGLKAKYIRDLRPNYRKKRIVENVRADHLKRQFNQPGLVTYKISLKNDVDLAVETLKEAIHSSKEKDLNGLVLHSD